MIRVLVASDYPMVRAGLQALLEGQEEFTVVAQAPADEELIALAAELRPDVLLLDLPGAEVDRALFSRLAAAVPGTGVVALSADPAAELAIAVLAAGARGYLFKEVSAEELSQAVRAVQQGLIVLHPAAARLMLGAASTPRGGPVESAVETLTARELEVLALLAQGLPNKTIASRLHLSEHTVKFHVGSIMGKLGAASRTEAVTLAARQGLIAL